MKEEKRSRAAEEPVEVYMPLVVINLQYLVLLIGTLFSGGFFGLLFGIIDIEDHYKHKMDLIFTTAFVELEIFMPVGLFHGSMVGFLFMMLRFCENKKRKERNIYRSYGGTFIGYKDISYNSHDEDDDDQEKEDDDDQTFYMKNDHCGSQNEAASDVDMQYEPHNLQPLRSK